MYVCIHKSCTWLKGCYCQRVHWGLFCEGLFELYVLKYIHWMYLWWIFECAQNKTIITISMSSKEVYTHFIRNDNISTDSLPNHVLNFQRDIGKKTMKSKYFSLYWIFFSVDYKNCFDTRKNTTKPRLFVVDYICRNSPQSTYWRFFYIN